jgi:hypothetical protein
LSADSCNGGGVPSSTRAESVRVYSPIVAVAFIHPDFEIVRVHTFSVQTQLLGLMPLPTAPVSGLHVQLDTFHVAVDGVTDAVNVTDCALGMLAGLAVTSSCGGVTVIVTDFCLKSPFTVADTVSVPDRVNGRRHVRDGASPVFGTNKFQLQGAFCVPKAGVHRTESIVHGTLKPPTCDGDTLAVTVTVSL